MEPLLLALASIVVIAALAWAARRWLGAPLCPVCVGVGGTWLWLLVARELGFGADTTVLALLLGGSVAGLAGQLEKRLPAGRSPLAWKALFIPPGFVVAHALASQRWLLAAAMALALAAVSAWFLFPRVAAARDSEQVEALTRKMENCC